MIKKILEDGKIKTLFSSLGSGTTGEAHLATYKKQKYVLRICQDNQTAKKYKRIYNLFKKQKFLPRLLESYKHYLLFEYIPGRDLKEKERPEIIKQVGKICGLINKSISKGTWKNKTLSKLKEIENKKIITKKLSKKTRKRYKQLLKRVELKFGWDAGDVTNDNFRLYKGKVYFVDIEAIKFQIKGFGLTKGLYVWFKDERSQEIFKKAYNSILNSKFYTKNYQEICLIIFLISRIRFKSNKGEKRSTKKAIKDLTYLTTK